LKYSGLIIFLIGIVLIVYSKIDKRPAKEYTLDLNEKRQTDEFKTPVQSKLKIKLNGKKEQKGHLVLQKKVMIPTATSLRPSNSPQERIIKKGNDKFEFNLDSDTLYYFVVQPYPFIPFIVDYSIVEFNSRQDQLFNLGVTFTATGLGIAFS